MSAPKTPPPRYSPYRGWAQQAPKVQDMVVKKGWGVSDAVREIVATGKYPDPGKAFRGIRAAYYELLKREAKKGKKRSKPNRKSKKEEFKI
jgi:hypothetical protein